MIMHVVKLSTYSTLGAVRRECLVLIAVGATAILANSLGKKFLERMSVRRFRQLVMWLMVVSGVFMI